MQTFKKSFFSELQKQAGFFERFKGLWHKPSLTKTLQLRRSPGLNTIVDKSLKKNRSIVPSHPKNY